ncbi:MAG TPA: hypothetical protein VGC20_00775 [bacterium]|jgi:hypothetical protein
MALFGGRFSAANRAQRAVVRALTELSDQQTPVHLVSEQTGASFYTLLSLHKTALVVARPRAVPGGLAKGSQVVLTLPNRQRQQVRMPVIAPKVKLPFSMRYACVCALPQEFSGQCRRGSDRINTKRYGNLRLHLPEQGRSYRVLDISNTGLRVYLTEDEAGLMLFEEGMEVAPSHLQVGKRVQIQLERLLPRAKAANWVGLEMRVAPDGTSERFLLNLLNKLRDAELNALAIDA